jgi:hypothetical protein
MTTITKTIKWHRQDYRLIAGNIKHTLECGGDSTTLRALAMGIALDFAKDNPQFDEDKFLEYCGLSTALVLP